MKFIPILFSTPMVRAILEGRKTQTRRVFKVKDPLGKKHQIDSREEEIIQFEDGGWNYRSVGGLSGPYPCPYGTVGDVLWVRETWTKGCTEDQYGCGPVEMYYRADGIAEAIEWYDEDTPEGIRNGPKWKPSIHMPKSAARIWLEITDIRVERVQSITEADAIAEGVSISEYPNDLPVLAYAGLWMDINGEGSWVANPWVWVVSFTRIDKPSNFK